jgi:hypothetical protein
MFLGSVANEGYPISLHTVESALINMVGNPKTPLEHLKSALERFEVEPGLRQKEQVRLLGQPHLFT